MNAAAFRLDVERELEQLRRAHVISDVELDTDLVVGIRFNIDGRPYQTSERARSADERRQAFELQLAVLRAVRRDVAPSRRPTPAAQVRIPMERHAGEPSWPLIAVLAVLCAVLAVALS